jgi:hypothetical protein
VTKAHLSRQVVHNKLELLRRDAAWDIRIEFSLEHVQFVLFVLNENFDKTISTEVY